MGLKKLITAVSEIIGYSVMFWFFTYVGLTQKLSQTPIPLCSLRPLRLDIP
ncbi:MAG: hypothetical protein F6K62_13905 [Sphaerospermopsis sp. SIO1G2]|nr:hypothetical protein [Sphaerospermopsis sp. SIO1G1]NET71980.1 hypothetical protein [Sphaerospermopsis sp. SIO1G2]